MSRPDEYEYDLILAGGGLASCMIAWRLCMLEPEARIAIVEAEPYLGGNHTWSFHQHDLNPEQREWIAPFVVHQWSAQQVRFPKYQRMLSSGYSSISSESLHRVMVAADRFKLKLSSKITQVERNRIVLSNGESVVGKAALDARGPSATDGMVLGFQKFVGQLVLLEQPHELTAPIIMDASVSQQDGYRFLYVLPFDRNRLLIEDTRYSDGSALSVEDLRSAIQQYASTQGWKIQAIEREEEGVLPILLAGDFERFWPDDPGLPARAGLAAGLFHPTTGYSLPQAVALADEIASNWPLNGDALSALTRNFTQTFWRDTRFFRLLNRMLFRAGRPEHRYRVLQRFYALSEPIVTRFYAADLKLHQKARILIGKPPVPILEALPLISEKRFLAKNHP